MRKHALMAFVVAGLISSIAVTDYCSAVMEPAEEVKPKVTVEAEAEPEPVKEEEPVGETFWMDLGEFEITAYCVGTCCSSGTGITASGNPAVEGKTIGVDPDIIPLGSEVKIVFADGTEHIYSADDTGAAINGNIIDLFMGGDHQAALNFGRQSCRVYVQEVNDPRN